MSESTAKPTFDPKMTVLQRMHAVRKCIQYLKKEKKVEGYMAVTHDQVTDYLRDHLIEFGVLVLPSMVPGTSKTVETGTHTGKGVPFIRFEVECEIVFINVDDTKDREVVRVTVHAIDHGDKAPGKALSYATKAAELKAFNIVTGEEDENRPEDQYGGMSVKEFEEWQKKIDAIADSKAGEALWKEIKAACAKHQNDETAVLKLRSHLSAKLSALKKNGAAKKPAKASEKEAAHA